MDFELDFLTTDLDMDLSEINDIAVQAAKRILNVTEEDIKDIENELCGLYPPEYAQNYVADIRVLQNIIKKL